MSDNPNSEDKDHKADKSLDHVSGISKIINFFVRAFPVFESRNYKLHFSGQLISLIGTWLTKLFPHISTDKFSLIPAEI